MSREDQLRALVATKQLEIDKLKRTIKEMEKDNGLRDFKNRKANKRNE